MCLTTNNIKSLLSNTCVKHPTTWHRQAKTEASLSSAARFSFALSVQAVPDHFAEARVVNAQGMQKHRVHARSLCYQQMKRVGSVSVGPPKNQVESVLFFGTVGIMFLPNKHNKHNKSGSSFCAAAPAPCAWLSATAEATPCATDQLISSASQVG